MKKTHFIVSLFTLLVIQGCTSRQLHLQVPVLKHTSIPCGEDSIVLYSYTGSADASFLFVNVHEDEQTSIDALRNFALENPINYIYLHHEQTRRIFFNLNDSTYNFDPNRMFTTIGRKKTLEDGGLWSQKADIAVEMFSEQILNPLRQAKIIVALHNNTADRYSIQSYMPDSSEAQNTAALYINPDMDPDDFIYTTDSAFFDFFKAKKINVILQDNSNFVDDGSLSVYSGIHALRYVNIETEHGHLQEQVRLLQMLHSYPAAP